MLHLHPPHHFFRHTNLGKDWIRTVVIRLFILFIVYTTVNVTIVHLNTLKFSRLEERREAVKKNDEDLEAQLAEADLRRKTLEDERTKKLAEISGLDKIEKVQ